MLRTPLVFILFVVVGCSSKNVKTIETQKDSIVKITYPVRPLHILTDEEEGGGADIRLSISEIEKNDSFAFYKILSTYNQKEVGFEVDIPTKPGLKDPLQFKSTGQNSNDFLQVLSKLYETKFDSTKKFTQNYKATFIDMNEFAKKELGQEISGIAGLKELKLFFESGKEKDYAELYLNINEKEHWIEVVEKDEEYRKPILSLLTKQ
jgi:hypothetical protein